MIQDQFTKLKVSRQRKWQMRRQATGLCKLCPSPRATDTYCLWHAILARDRQHRKNRCKRSNYSLTRRIQKQIAIAKRIAKMA